MKSSCVSSDGEEGPLESTLAIHCDGGGERPPCCTDTVLECLGSFSTGSGLRLSVSHSESLSSLTH